MADSSMGAFTFPVMEWWEAIAITTFGAEYCTKQMTV
jgi:hypothetical protein